MTVGRLAQLWRYPVKSMQGERLERAVLTPDGIPGDRGLAVLDAQTGHTISGKRVERLVQARAAIHDGEVVITLPDGRSVPAVGADAVLSAWLQREVRIARPSHERPTIDSEGGRTFRGRAGGFFDSSPLHLVTDATLAHLQTLYEGDFDVRRFRPNLYVETDRTGPVERSWIGATLRIGDADLAIARECTRCIMTTSQQADLPKDRGILATIAREQDDVVGVHAQVASMSEVAVGDPVALSGSDAR